MNTKQSSPSTASVRKPEVHTLADLLRDTANAVAQMGDLVALPGMTEFEPETLCYPASGGAEVLLRWADAMRNPSLRVYAGHDLDVCVEAVGEVGPAQVPLRIAHPLVGARPWLLSSDVPYGESRSLPLGWLRSYADHVAA